MAATWQHCAERTRAQLPLAVLGVRALTGRSSCAATSFATPVLVRLEEDSTRGVLSEVLSKVLKTAAALPEKR
jgi:hypothetical protein